MANYSFISNAKFRPFSYQEMLQPLQAYTQEYNTIQEGMNELGTKASVFDKMANEQTDPQAYAMYKQYSDDLAKQAESLAKQGLTPASRQGLMDMRKKYSTTIVPIEQAYKRRQELVDEQRKLQAQDSTLLFDRPASTLSLDELISNPTLSPQSHSGALLAKQVGTASQSLAKEVRENPRKWRTILGNQYYETIMQKGFRPEEIMQAVQNNPEASPILQGIVEDAIESSGIKDWNDEDILKRAYGYAREGLWSAVGETQYQTISNKAYDHAMQDQLARDKEARARAAKEAEEKTGLYYRAVPKTTVDGDKETTQMNAGLQVLREVLANPALLDQASTRTVREPRSPYPTMTNLITPYPMTNLWMDTGTGLTRQETYYPYQEKLKELSKRYGNINYTITDGKLSGGNLAELAQQLDRDIRSSVVRSFSYKPNITQSDLITQVLKENTRSYYRRSNSTGLWKLDGDKKGDEIKIGNLNNYFTSDADIDFDPDLGFIINSTDSEGTTRSAILDTELLDDQNRTFSRAQQAIKVALENGEDELATTLIDATMEAFYKRYNTLEKRQSNTFSKEE